MQNTVLPTHVAFIMDGNGRWATARGKNRSYGHKAGYQSLQNVIKYSFERGVKVLSFYAFSTENWARPKDEVEKLMSLMASAIKNQSKTLLKKQIRLIISGDYSMLKPSVKRAIDQVLQKTASFSERVVNICFNYGGRAEICNAVNQMLQNGVTECTEESLAKYLYTKDVCDPDLVIRTSGEQRLSNFLLWQSAYSELYFTPVCWPDFDGAEMEKALAWYSERQRRFGKV